MNRRRKALLATITVALLLLMLEGALRLSGYSYNPYQQFMLGVAGEAPAEFDQHLFWRPAGPVNRELEQRPASLPGVLVLSDSVGVLSKFPDALLVALTRRLGGHEPVVRNAAVTGYTSHQGLRLLERSLGAAQPDAVVVNFGYNDHWNTGNGRTDRQQQPPPATVTRLVGSSRLLGLMAASFMRLRLDHYKAFPPPARANAYGSPPPSTIRTCAAS